MTNWLEKYARSIRFWILVVACTYLAYAFFFAINGFTFSLNLISDHYVYNLVTQNSWWWQILYYGSEGVFGVVATVIRAIAGVFAVYAAYMFWRKKDAAVSAIRKSASNALLLEAAFFLCLIPYIIAAVAYNLTSEYLYYFEHTPPLMLLLGTAIPCTAIVLVVPPFLLKLRSKIKAAAPKEEIVKWLCLTGLGYLFVVFWFNYSMLWLDSTMTYPRANEQFGLGFILQPANLLSFAVTVFGLLALGIVSVATVLPVIKKQSIKLNLTRVGAILTAFGAYFLFNTFVYYLTGGYPAHPSVWYEVIGPLHNSNLWCLALIFLGVPLIVKGRIKKKIV
jgi:hypothetical protein